MRKCSGLRGKKKMSIRDVAYWTLDALAVTAGLLIAMPFFMVMAAPFVCAM